MAKVRKDNKGRNLRPGETQRADGSYMYVYKLGTKKKYLYDSDLASLRVKEKQINKDKDDGIRTQEAMKLTLNDMFKVYMNNNIKLKPSTRANYLYLWDFYVKEEPFANMPLPQIHRSDILAFYTKLLKHGFAINSLESINTIVHPTLEMAVDDDYIRKNPSKGIYRKLKTDGSAPKPKRRIALTKTQQQNFLRFIAKSPTYSHWLPIMTVLLGTGMRVAECTGITKSDINLSENTISVNHNLIYRVIDGKAGFHITTPKTESGTRIIPILYPEVAEQLRLQIETIDALYPDDQLVLGGVHGFVFRNRTGSFMSAHNINRAIERISVTYNMEEMDQAELEDREPDLLPHFSVHNLRHTFCTRLCESTNDVKFIQQVMGHADFSTTMDIYTHITQENMQEKPHFGHKGSIALWKNGNFFDGGAVLHALEFEIYGLVAPQQIIFELGFVASETGQRQTRRNAHRTFGRQAALPDFFCNGCQRQQVIIVVRRLVPLDRLPPCATNKKVPAKL
jgi:integrase